MRESPLTDWREGIFYGNLKIVKLRTMLDLFDLMLSPRVIVVSDSELKKHRIEKLESKRDLYKKCLSEVERELKELVD